MYRIVGAQKDHLWYIYTSPIKILFMSLILRPSWRHPEGSKLKAIDLPLDACEVSTIVAYGYDFACYSIIYIFLFSSISAWLLFPIHELGVAYFCPVRNAATWPGSMMDLP